MKKLLCILIMIIISLFTVNVAFAHPGRTDSNGGHWDHDTGEYHYHDGESAGQSGSSSSSSSSSSFSPNKWYKRGLEDGLKQRCIDYNYQKSYLSGFEQSCKDFAKTHLLFNLLIKFDNRDILYPSGQYVSGYEHEKIRSEYFDDYYIPSGYTRSEERSAYIKFIEGYEESYDNAIQKNLSKEYFTTTKALQAKEDGYNDACEHFTSATLYAYKEYYPIESFFVLLPTYALILISLVILFVLLFVVLLIRNKRKKAASEDEEQTEITATQIRSEESDSRTISAPSESNKFTVGTDFSAGYVEFVPETLTSYIRILPAKGIKENIIKRITKPEKIKLEDGDVVYIYDCEIPCLNKAQSTKFPNAIHLDIENTDGLNVDFKREVCLQEVKKLPTPENAKVQSTPDYIFEVGSDIFYGTYTFSKVDPVKDAYFISQNTITGKNKTTTKIYKENQRYYFINGEKLELYNCKIEPYD